MEGKNENTIPFEEMIKASEDTACFSVLIKIQSITFSLMNSFFHSHTLLNLFQNNVPVI